MVTGQLQVAALVSVAIPESDTCDVTQIAASLVTDVFHRTCMDRRATDGFEGQWGFDDLVVHFRQMETGLGKGNLRDAEV